MLTVTVLVFPLTGSAAFADDSPQAVPTLAPAMTVHPKRLGYFEPVAAGLGGSVPPVSSQHVADLAGAAGGLAAQVPGVVAAATAALGDAAASYRLYKAATIVHLFNERDELVYEDRMTFRYRQSRRDGAISAVTTVPEESWCKTSGGLSMYAFTPVIETCWYVVGYAGPDIFSFVTGSRFSSYVGPLRWGVHHVGDGYATYRDGSYSFAHDESVNGSDRCPTVSALPPGWYADCSQGRRTEVVL